MFLAVALGCWDGGNNQNASTNAEDLRIVSFVPSATRILVDLDMKHQLVGVAEHDSAAPTSGRDGEPLPIVGHFLAIDHERLLTLNPTHVVYPVTESGVPDALREMADTSGFALIEEPYPASVLDVVSSVRRLGRSFGVDGAAEALAVKVDFGLQFEAEFREVVQHVLDKSGMSDETGSSPGNPSPSLLLVFAVNPVVASGPGSVNDELIGLAGGRNAVADAAVSAVTLDREALVAVAPQVVVLLLPGATADEANEKCVWFDGLPIPAATSNRIFAITDPQVLLPSTNLPGVVRTLAEIVKGERSGTSGESRLITSTEPVEETTPAEASP